MKKESTKEKSKPAKVLSEEKTTVNYRRIEMFDLIERNNEDIIIVFGNSIVSERAFKTFEEAEKYLNSKPYEIIFATTCAIVRNIK